MNDFHTKIASPFLLPSIKIQGYNLQQYRYTSSSCSHGLSHTIIEIFYYATIQYNTIISCFTMISFIGEIQWENSRVNPIPWVCNTVRQHTSQKHFLGAPSSNPKAGGMSVQYTWGTNTTE